MCAFYDCEQKIKKGDTAIYKNETVSIVSIKHIKENKTMNIEYLTNGKNEVLNVPYKTYSFGFSLIKRAELN